MPIADTKKVQALIQGVLAEVTKLELADANLQNLKTKYQNHNPDLAGSSLTTKEAQDANVLIAGLNVLLSDNAVIIATLKGKDAPSHGIASLD